MGNSRRCRHDMYLAHARVGAGHMVPASSCASPAERQPSSPSPGPGSFASCCDTHHTNPLHQPSPQTLTFHPAPNPAHTPLNLLSLLTQLSHLLIHAQTKTSPSRPLLLASLSTSTTNRQPPPRRFHNPRNQAPNSGLGPPPRLVTTLQGLPLDFVAAQTQAEQIYNFHMASNGLFPRPCPHCSSGEFLLPLAAADQQRTDSPPVSTASGTSRPSLVDPPSSSSQPPAPVWFRSRPLVCEQCQRWFHMGCMDIGYMEDVPSRPWFHCRGCRDAFVKMEGLRRRGPILLPTSASGLVTVAFATPSDLAAVLAGVRTQVLRSPSPSDRLRRPMARANPGPAAHTDGDEGEGGSRSLVLPLLDLLGGGELEGGVVERLMDPGAEYDAGRYAMVMRKDGVAVGAAAFNVFGPDLPAQVNLIAAADGFHQPLLELLETALDSELGVNCVLTQPQPGLSQAQAAALGYCPLHPRDVAQLHMAMPLAFLDAAVLGKEL